MSKLYQLIANHAIKAYLRRARGNSESSLDSVAVLLAFLRDMYGEVFLKHAFDKSYSFEKNKEN